MTIWVSVLKAWTTQNNGQVTGRYTLSQMSPQWLRCPLQSTHWLTGARSRHWQLPETDTKWMTTWKDDQVVRHKEHNLKQWVNIKNGTRLKTSNFMLFGLLLFLMDSCGSLTDLHTRLCKWHLWTWTGSHECVHFIHNWQLHTPHSHLVSWPLLSLLWKIATTIIYLKKILHKFVKIMWKNQLNEVSQILSLCNSRSNSCMRILRIL